MECLEQELLDDPERGLVVIPGISSGPYGRLFDEVVEFAQQEHYSVVRINAWESAEELEEMTLHDLHDKVTQANQVLQENQCDEITILGKSFGGQIALTHPNTETFNQMILWAPALDISQKGNIDKWKQTKLKEAETATDITISENKLRKTNTQTCIIHGKKDQVISVETSKQIQNIMPECKLKQIPNTGHSYENKEKALIKYSKEKLSKTVAKHHK